MVLVAYIILRYYLVSQLSTKNGIQANEPPSKMCHSFQCVGRCAHPSTQTYFLFLESTLGTLRVLPFTNTQTTWYNHSQSHLLSIFSDFPLFFFTSFHHLDSHKKSISRHKQLTLPQHHNHQVHFHNYSTTYCHL